MTSFLLTPTLIGMYAMLNLCDYLLPITLRNFTRQINSSCVIGPFVPGFAQTNNWLDLMATNQIDIPKVAKTKTKICQILIPKLFKNGRIPASFCLLSSFQTNNTVFTRNKYEKYQVHIWRRDLNPRPLKHESSPITTRPGLPPLIPKL